MKGKIVKKFEKVLVINGKRHRLTAKAELEDGIRVPRNYIYGFGISGQLDIYAFGGWHCKECGQITDRITKHFPELRSFMSLHMCNYKGQPSSCVENGIYYIQQGDKEGCMRFLRISEEEYEKLLPAAQLNDKLYFKYLLFKVGIVDRWKREADKFIKFLLPEGETWENPYTIGEERPTLALSNADKYVIELRIKDGDFSEENIKRVLAMREKRKREDERSKILEEYSKKVQEASNKRDVMLYILDHGLPVDNVIYYSYCNKVAFNWESYKKGITQEQFDDFMDNLEREKLPDGIQFVLGDK